MELSANTLEAIVNIDETNAQQMLIEESSRRLVVADFWADWCEPCKQLMPVLEKLAEEYNGQFLLAKVNADEQQMIAQQLQIQSLPTVMLIKDGQPIDGFAGLQPERQIRELLDKYLPKPWDEALVSANLMMSQQQFSEALNLLRPMLEASGKQANIVFAMIQCLLELRRLDDAEQMLNDVAMVDQDEVFAQLKSQLDLKRAAGKTPEITALEEALERSPDDLSAKLQLAVKLSEEQISEDALEHLIQILRKDREFSNGEAKKVMLDVFKTLGNQDPLVVKYQRQLFSLLY
jgi:putative thioredoxin